MISVTPVEAASRSDLLPPDACVAYLGQNVAVLVGVGRLGYHKDHLAVATFALIDIAVLALGRNAVAVTGEGKKLGLDTSVEHALQRDRQRRQAGWRWKSSRK